MGYALFAQRKVLIDSNLQTVELQQTQRSNEQYALATEQNNLQQQMTSMNASQAGELAKLYEELADANEDGRNRVNAEIKEKEEAFQQELDEINREIYVISSKEEALEMEVKRLDTMVTELQKQLQAIEDAEGDSIEKATPEYNGVG